MEPKLDIDDKILSYYVTILFLKLKWAQSFIQKFFSKYLNANFKIL